MKFYIKHQESYSRGELLLRTLFGFIYILLPHAFVLIFVGLWGAILSFISFWVVLFTGRYPQSFFEFQVGLIRWNTRVSARLNNLADGYPAFGINATDDYSDVQIEYPERLSRGLQLVKVLFGVIYVGIPHGFMLIFRMIGTMVLTFLAWWVVLFTGNYPKSWHDFNVGTLRWQTRVNVYLSYMSDDYPPFSGKPDPDDTSGGSEPAEITDSAPQAPPETPAEPESGPADESDHSDSVSDAEGDEDADAGDDQDEGDEDSAGEDEDENKA